MDGKGYCNFFVLVNLLDNLILSLKFLQMFHIVRQIQKTSFIHRSPSFTYHIITGAGKSTLVNRLAGQEIMRTGGIREEDSKGRHTTTHREMVEVNEVYLIDTPGLRELGMMDAEEGIAGTFADIAELTGRCAFSDCTHRNEPGCAVREALENGSLSPERWKTYSRLEKENSRSKILKNERMMKMAMERRKMNTAREKRR